MYLIIFASLIIIAIHFCLPKSSTKIIFIPKTTNNKLATNLQQQSEINETNLNSYEYISKCPDLAHCHADIGITCPLELYTESIYIIPYQKASLDLQITLAKELLELNPEVSKEYILDNWKGSDIMYVMASFSNNEFIGSIAVDRKNFEPFISHLFVANKYRKKGHAKRLLTFALEYSKCFKFNVAKLWCKPELVPFYTKLNWTFDSKKEDLDLVIMKFQLSN
jgi:GNAT superfamily N-acetyltransferase